MVHFLFFVYLQQFLHENKTPKKYISTLIDTNLNKNIVKGLLWILKQQLGFVIIYKIYVSINDVVNTLKNYHIQGVRLKFFF